MTVEAMGQTIILDAGSGIAQMDRLAKIFAHKDKPYDILLSHLHLDHIIGLTVFSKIWTNSPQELVRIYTIDRDERPLQEQIFGLFVPPYWPVSMVELANAQCIAITEGHPLQLDTFTVTPFSAAHPDKTVSFHITDGNSSLVYLLDCETQALSEDGWDTLVGYCKNADLVVFDSAYSAIDYPEKKGWGHSTIQDGFTLARASQCKRMMFTHFGFEYSDQELEILEFQATAQDNTFLFAREGLELVL